MNATYETYSTELSAALRAVGCDLQDRDPMRRIFSEERPCNPAVTHGLARGGQVQYRHKGESEEFGAQTLKLAQTYSAPSKRWNGESWAPIPEEETFDAMVETLRGKLRGSEAGVLLEKIVGELPHEIMRYLRAGFDRRRENIDTIATQREMTELVKIKKEDGHFVIHHAGMSPEKVQTLLEA